VGRVPDAGLGWPECDTYRRRHRDVRASTEVGGRWHISVSGPNWRGHSRPSVLSMSTISISDPCPRARQTLLAGPRPPLLHVATDSVGEDAIRLTFVQPRTRKPNETKMFATCRFQAGYSTMLNYEQSAKAHYNARMLRRLPILLFPFLATLASAQTRIQDVIYLKAGGGVHDGRSQACKSQQAAVVFMVSGGGFRPLHAQELYARH